MVHSISLLGSALLTASLAQAKPYGGGVTKSTLPFSLFEGDVTPEDISVEGGLDWPKLAPGVNGTTYDWWYFDVVSATDNTAVTVVLYNFANGTLAVPYLGGPLLADLIVTFENGTSVRKFTAANKGADFQISDKGIASQWNSDESQYSFTGTSLDEPNPVYTISIDDPVNSVSGSIKFNSVSPPHYPCDVNKAGVSEDLFPNVWWANAVPDSDASVDLVIDGEEYHLQGYGYHDKNWGVDSLDKTTKTWYWGHGRVGPYSMVWFDAVEKAGKEHFSSWLVKDGEVLAMSCADQASVVRPWGNNSLYPPTTGLTQPSGYTIRFDLGDDKAFVANFTSKVVSLDMDIYKRQIGPLVGGIEGEEQFEGMSQCEQFAF
ncbi:hypothetical protein KVR01_008202 [Diaporthe batatas]|uniref:uncharacterized protein n=1 Tax=Diaporthe batatas TaxID=748121 RepID=UPI001D048586|nr:uncharacterized protein KVR01_008202 [Diaporthe batatas]KAG8162437.1 hypothetical protein KVR01_008202 [Diaporthe batatas]